MSSFEVWIFTLGSVLVISLISLVGVFLLGLKEKQLSSILTLLVAFSIGALFGDAFIHLLPEAFEKFDSTLTSISVLVGVFAFFILERFIHWHHCHDTHVCSVDCKAECEAHFHHVHVFGYVNLVGEAVHNFVDGIVIATSFIVSVPVGVATTIAVIFHEIPQEIGDFAVLLKAGFSKIDALKFNFLSALFAVVGAVATLIFATGQLTQFLVPFAAGSFIYLAGSDLVPHLREDKKHSLKTTILHVACMALGSLVMLGLKLYFK